jgi:hypothetical protein
MIDEFVKSYIMPLRNTVTENNLSIISKGYDLVSLSGMVETPRLQAKLSWAI